MAECGHGLVVPARKLHPSEKLTLEQLALVETLAIGCHAVNRAQVERDEWALVIGVGPIGLAVLEFLRLAGARIIVLDRNAARLDFCRRTYGIEHAVQFNGDESELAAIQKTTGGTLPSVVFDATGSQQSMYGAIHFVAHTGQACLRWHCERRDFDSRSAAAPPRDHGVRVAQCAAA